MPAGLTRSPASSPAFRGLLASPWKARLPYRLRLFNARSSQSTYATITEAMLKKAVSAHAAPPPPSKNDLAKTLFPSSSPAQDGNIEEQFKKARQSIGGFAGVSNRVNPSNPLRGSSANVKLPFKRSDTFSSTNTSSNSSTNSSHRASTSSTYRPSTSGLSSVLNKPDAFQNTPDTVLSQETPPSSKVVHAAVEFDENDFDDDDDIDLDMDYELPSTKSMQPPPKPARRPDISEFAYNSKPPPEQASPQLPQRTVNTKSTSYNPTSSAQTWSSSPQSHYKSPPGAVLRRQREASTQASAIDLTQDNDINPRPAKRRTLPWMQEEAEEAEILAKKEEKEIKAARATSRASPTGDRLISKFKREESTPAPKEKHMPWNTTASAIKDQQRLFKEKQSKAKKDAVTAGQAMTSHSSRRAAPIQLSDEQTRVLELVVNQGKSVFFTGSAGTGKSVLMRAIIDKLRKKFMREPDRVAVTASTGLAACNIGGVTLHSFGGIGLGKEDVATLVKKIKRNAKAKNRWLRTKILIVDEISMVDGDLFDKLEGIARAMRNNGRPFGGIQLVITGDFFQLPPVPDHDKKDRAVKFAFDAATWGTSIHHTIGLTEVFRQKDPVFANMLNEMRLGNISNDTIQAFKKLSRPINYEDSLDATELFPTRYEVENSNAVRMRGLHGKSYVFPAKDGGAIKDEKMLDKLLSNMMAPKTIELKKGAQVMLIKNMDEMLVNGSLGKVTAFMSEKSFEIFANTYNDNPDIFDSNVPDETLDDESLEQRQRFNNLKARDRLDTGTLYPLVEFAIADGTRRSILVQPEEWKVELPNGEIQAQRSQLPLILAWALSIHKAQGQTLERVKIDLKKIFEKGQAYVALSRATSQAGLEVKNFDKSKVMAHPRVGQFYSSLYSVNKALEHPKVAAPAVPAPKTTKVEEPSMSNMVQPRGTVFDDDEEEAMAAFG